MWATARVRSSPSTPSAIAHQSAICGYGETRDVGERRLVVQAARELLGGVGQERELGGLVGHVGEGLHPVECLCAGVRHDIEEVELGGVELATPGERHRGRPDRPVTDQQRQAHHRALALGRALECRVAGLDRVAADEDQRPSGGDAVPGGGAGHREGLPTGGHTSPATVDAEQPQPVLRHQHRQRGDGGPGRVGHVAGHDRGHGGHVVRPEQLRGHAREPGEPVGQPLCPAARPPGVLDDEQRARRAVPVG